MTYLRFVWRNNRGFLIFALILVPLFQFFILRIVTTFEISPLISNVVSQMPGNVRKMVGEDALSMLSVEGSAAFGFNHPLVLVIMAIAAIMIPSRHIAGEVENGTLELLLSFPVRRIRLLLSLFLAGTAFLLLISLFALGASLGGLALFYRFSPETALKLVGIAVNLWLLFTVVASLTLALSAFGKEGNKVALRAAGITLVLYLLHYLSSLWDALHFTKPINIFTYFQPTQLMSGERGFAMNYAVLCSLIVVCLGLSAYQFNRRDIP